MNEHEKEIVRQKLKKEIEENEAAKQEKENQISQIEIQLSTIKNHVQTMVENFKMSHFFLSVAQNA